MRLSPRLGRAITATIVAVALVGLVVVLVNPFDWFLQRSGSFSVDRFLAIEPGADLTQVVELLGEPILTKEDLPSYSDCHACSAHYFLGAPPDWLFAYREAWVLVDAEGKVVQRTLNDEP